MTTRWRLTSLALKDFRCFEEAEFEFAPVTIIVGANDAGKSTIIDALSVALTGCTRGAERGIGLEVLGRNGSMKWSVSATLSNGTEEVVVERKRTQGPRSALQGRVNELFGLGTHEAIRACLTPHYFLNLPPATAAQIVAAMLDARVKMGAELAGLIEQVPGLKLALGADPNKDLTPPMIQGAYRLAYEMRREAKLRLSAASSPETIETPKPPFKLDGPPADVLKAVVDELEQLSRSHENAVRSNVAARAQAERAAIQRDQIAHRVRSFEIKLGELGDPIDTSEIEVATEAARLEERALQKEIEEARTTAWAAKTDIETAEKSFAQLQGGREGKCQTCNQKLTVAQAKKRGDELKEFVRRMSALLVDATRAMERGEARARELAATIGELTGKTENAKATEYKRKEILREIQGARSELMNLPAIAETPPIDTTEMDARIDGLSKKANELRVYIATLQAVEQTARRSRSASDGDAGLVQTLERLCEILGPKGIILEAKESGGSMVDSLNEALEAFDLELDTEPLYSGKGSPRLKANGVDLSMFSRSAQLRASACYQIALAKASGVGIVCIDDLDCLDSFNRGVFSDLVGCALKLGVQVIAAKVFDEDVKDELRRIAAFNAEQTSDLKYIVMAAPGPALLEEETQAQ